MGESSWRFKSSHPHSRVQHVAVNPLMGLATVWPALFGARLLDRVGAGTRSAPRDALIASSVDKENRGRAFGLEGVGDNAGAFLGPLLAAFLLYAVHADIRTIFYLAVIPGLLAFLMVLLVKERCVPFSAKSKIDIGLDRFPTEYWRYLLAIALFGIGNSSNSFLILRTQDIGVSLEQTILIYAAFNLVAALISYPAGSLSDQWGRRNLLLVSFVIFLIAYLGFALTQNILMIAGLFVFYGLYQGIFRAVGKAFASDFVPDACAPARSAGTARVSACWNSWPALSPACSGTGSAMWPCSITARFSR